MRQMPDNNGMFTVELSTLGVRRHSMSSVIMETSTQSENFKDRTALKHYHASVWLVYEF